MKIHGLNLAEGDQVDSEIADPDVILCPDCEGWGSFLVAEEEEEECGECGGKGRLVIPAGETGSLKIHHHGSVLRISSEVGSVEVEPLRAIEFADMLRQLAQGILDRRTHH